MAETKKKFIVTGTVYSVYEVYRILESMINNRKINITDWWKEFFEINPSCPSFQHIKYIQDDGPQDMLTGQAIAHDRVTTVKEHMRVFLKLAGVDRPIKHFEVCATYQDYPNKRLVREKDKPKYFLLDPKLNEPEVQEAVREELDRVRTSMPPTAFTDTPNNEVLTPEFVKPTQQEALGGELGVTSLDLAKSLGVRHQYVRTKLDRAHASRKWTNHGWRITPYGVVSKQKVLEVEGFVLNIPAAKYFIGNWNNETGRSYFRYLLSCEDIVENTPPVRGEGRFSKADLAEIMSMSMAMYHQVSLPEVEKVVKNTQRHEEAMLSASQQAICQPLFTAQNQKHYCSMIHSLIKKAAKIRYRPDAPASDCTWHKIRQSDFEELLVFIKGYELTELDVKRVEKFHGTEAGKKDRLMWAKREAAEF